MKPYGPGIKGSKSNGLKAFRPLDYGTGKTALSSGAAVMGCGLDQGESTLTKLLDAAIADVDALEAHS